MTTAMEKIADSVWLKAIERVAIPLIMLMLWQQYQTLQTLQLKSPVTDYRIASLETTVKAATTSGVEAKEQREANQIVLVRQITGLEKDVAALQKTIGEVNQSVKDLTRISTP